MKENSLMLWLHNGLSFVGLLWLLSQLRGVLF